jgi:hypothetical protein
VLSPKCICFSMRIVSTRERRAARWRVFFEEPGSASAVELAGAFKFATPALASPDVGHVPCPFWKASASPRRSAPSAAISQLPESRRLPQSTRTPHSAESPLPRAARTSKNHEAPLPAYPSTRGHFCRRHGCFPHHNQSSADHYRCRGRRHFAGACAEIIATSPAACLSA